MSYAKEHSSYAKITMDEGFLIWYIRIINNGEHNMTRNAQILEALTKNLSGLTVIELSLLLNRTGGDITKGISSLRKNKHEIQVRYCVQPYNKRKTAHYTLKVS